MPYVEMEGIRGFVCDWSEKGVAGGPPLVLLHGAGMDHSVWAFQGRALAVGRGPVLAPDLPAHGRSEGPPRERIEAFVEWLRRLLDRCLDRPPVLIGHSMGSLIALEHAAHHPVSGLVLLGSALRMPVHPRLLELAARDPAAAARQIVTWSLPRPVRFGGQPLPGAWVARAAERLIERAPPGVLACDLGACDRYTGGLEATARVDCPVLVIAGERDRMTRPKEAEALAGRLARCRHVLLPDCGHMMMLERPGETLRLIAGFVDQLPD